LGGLFQIEIEVMSVSKGKARALAINSSAMLTLAVCHRKRYWLAVTIEVKQNKAASYPLLPLLQPKSLHASALHFHPHLLITCKMQRSNPLQYLQKAKTHTLPSHWLHHHMQQRLQVWHCQLFFFYYSNDCKACCFS